MTDLPRVVWAIVQGCLLMAVAFVGSQLWATNNEVREMQGDLKYMIGQSARVDRLADAVSELRRTNAVRDNQIEDLIKRGDVHRDVLLKLQQRVDRP
jgi:type II secretory pathway component PulM